MQLPVVEIGLPVSCSGGTKVSVLAEQATSLRGETSGALAVSAGLRCELPESAELVALAAGA